MEILEFPNYPEERGLFIDTKGLTLNVALLPSGDRKISTLVVHSVEKRESYDNISLLHNPVSYETRS